MKITSLLIITLLLAATDITAQTVTPNMARVAGKGIMIFAGEQIPAGDGRVTGYTIERRAEGEDYKTVATLRPVRSLAEFKTRFAQSGALLPYPPYLEGYQLDSIWIKGTTRGDIKVLGVAGISLPVLYGFNIVWLDEHVRVGTSYQYRVTAAGSGAERVSAPVVYTKDVPIAMPHILYSSFGQDGVKMKWYAAGKNKPAYMTVFRSDNKGAFHFVPCDILALPVNDTTIYTLTDSLLIPNQVYDYYLQAYDVLGNAAPRTDTVRLVSAAYTRMPLPEDIVTAADTVNQGIRITWRTHHAVMLKKLVLYRSENSVDGFVPVATIAPTDSVYTDVRVMPATPYFYYFGGVMKLDDAEKRTSSFAARYEEPRKPTTADLLEADAAPEGITLSWTYTRGNIQGFHVYRMLPGGDMQLVSPLVAASDTQTVFTFRDADPVRNESTFYGYAVKAISTSNVTGDFSDTVMVRPVKAVAPPAAPVQPEAAREGKNMLLTWNNMQEDDNDIAGYMVIRAAACSTDTFMAGRNMYTDTSVLREVNYSYTVAAVNVFGKWSAPSAAVSYSLPYDLPVAPSSLTASVKKNGIYLSWQLPENGEGYVYHIYRRTRETEAQLVGKTAKSQDTFTDTSALADGLYFYTVRSVSPEQKESSDSDETGIRYEAGQ